MSQPTLLHYRPWRGEFNGPLSAVWAIARVGLRMMFRFWPFWVIYSLGLMIFLLFFFGQYLLAWADTQIGEADVRVGGFGRTDPHDLIRGLRYSLKLSGNADTYSNFFHYQSYIILVVLALAGSLLIGNDIRHGSLPFYLSKPISRWHYLLGKCLSVGVFINMVTTLPALLLFAQIGLLDGWDYIRDGGRLFLGILGYGLTLTVVFSLLLVAIASRMRTTVPLLLTWTTVFLFPRLIAATLVDRMHFDTRWRLIDLWNDCYLVGNWCLGNVIDNLRPQPQPEIWLAALTLLGVCLVCVASQVRRLKAVEIVR
jgi:ABC-type transport system involved in multi-copper enzyme maturation permease subunit